MAKKTSKPTGRQRRANAQALATAQAQALASAQALAVEAEGGRGNDNAPQEGHTDPLNEVPPINTEDLFGLGSSPLRSLTELSSTPGHISDIDMDIEEEGEAAPQQYAEDLAAAVNLSLAHVVDQEDIEMDREDPGPIIRPRTRSYVQQQLPGASRPAPTSAKPIKAQKPKKGPKKKDAGPKPEPGLVIPGTGVQVSMNATFDKVLRTLCPNGTINRDDPNLMALLLAETATNLLNNVLLETHAAGYVQFTKFEILNMAVLFHGFFRLPSHRMDENTSERILTLKFFLYRQILSTEAESWSIRVRTAHLRELNITEEQIGTYPLPRDTDMTHGRDDLLPLFQEFVQKTSEWVRTEVLGAAVGHANEHLAVEDENQTMKFCAMCRQGTEFVHCTKCRRVAICVDCCPGLKAVADLNDMTNNRDMETLHVKFPCCLEPGEPMVLSGFRDGSEHQLRLVGSRCAVTKLEAWDCGAITILNVRLSTDTNARLVGELVQAHLKQHQPVATVVNPIQLFDMPFNMIKDEVDTAVFSHLGKNLCPHFKKFIP